MGWATCSMPANLPRASHAHLRRSRCRKLGRRLCRQRTQSHRTCRTCRILRIPQKTGTSTCAKSQRLTAGRGRRAGVRAYFWMLRAGVSVANAQLKLPTAKQAWLVSSSCRHARKVNHWFLVIMRGRSITRFCAEVAVVAREAGIRGGDDGVLQRHRGENFRRIGLACGERLRASRAYDAFPRPVARRNDGLGLDPVHAGA